MDTTILAVTGRKQSGKTSLCAFIEASLTAYAYRNEDDDVRNGDAKFDPTTHFQQLPDGRISWEWGGVREADGLISGPGAPKGLVGVYNFADSLKEVCVSVLGLKPEQCYGTDEEKNSLTRLVWEKIPYYVRWYNSGRKMYKAGESSVFDAETTEEAFYRYVYVGGWQPYELKSGQMTGREVMQVFGTDVMRNMFDKSVWVNATIKKIQCEKPKVALIADCRFRGEWEAVNAAGGYAIRLERHITNDTHESEIDFDGFDWSQYERALVIPAEADLKKKNAMALKWLRKTAKMEL